MRKVSNKVEDNIYAFDPGKSEAIFMAPLKKATPFLQRSDAVIRMVDDQFKDKKLRDRMKMLAENIDKDDKGKENK